MPETHCTEKRHPPVSVFFFFVFFFVFLFQYLSTNRFYVLMTAHYVSPFCEKGDYSKKIIATAGPRLAWDLKMISLQQEILIHPDYKISLQPAKVNKEYEQLGPGLKTSFSTSDLSVHTAFTIAGVHCNFVFLPFFF